MCGIVGYIGEKQAIPIMLCGLEKLEYRGYDSAGIAVIENNKLKVFKTKGRINNLKELLNNNGYNSSMGIGHTRWATHGKPSDINAHPHSSNSNKFAVVHNGIIENYLDLKEELIKKGVKFISETDTEVIAQLLEYYDTGNFVDTVFSVVSKLQGAFSIGIICKDNPDELIAVKKDSPLIIGLGDGENYIASDIPAILSKTRKIYRLDDEEIAVIKKDKINIYNFNKEIVYKNVFTVDWDITSAEKMGYEHFMMKEIMEQPKAVRDTIYPRIKNNKIIFDQLSLSENDIKNLNRIYIVACGSAYHVGCVAKYTIEKIAKIPVEVDFASEFRYRKPLLNKNDLIIIISQSGETADSLAALRESKKNGVKVLSIVNVVGSTIANESDNIIYTWAGPEIAVATTKAYSAQLVVIYLLALYMADKLGTISNDIYTDYINELLKLPDKIESILKRKDELIDFCKIYFNSRDIFFIGRNVDYAVCLEGSLKLKEVSYAHSEAYAAGELKHGPISLIENDVPVIALATQDDLFYKMLSNIKEVKARGAAIFSIAVEGNTKIEQVSDYNFYIPTTCDIMLPSLSVIPLQFISYYVALYKNCDIDKPRNLAKSVTVE